MPADFNPSFQVPNWGWWIVLYFFFGGVTGGVYFAAAWLDLFGDLNDRAAMRLGHLLALPLIVLCSVFLIADLGQHGITHRRLDQDRAVRGGHCRGRAVGGAGGRGRPRRSRDRMSGPRASPAARTPSSRRSGHENRAVRQSDRSRKRLCETMSVATTEFAPRASAMNAAPPFVVPMSRAL